MGSNEFILIVDPDSRTTSVVVENSYNADASGPKWSPDGKMMSFERTVDDTSNLYVLDWDTKDGRLVMPQVHSSGIWSPDSTLILVESQVQGVGLYVVSVQNGQHWKIPNTGDDTGEVRYTSYDWLFPYRNGGLVTRSQCQPQLRWWSFGDGQQQRDEPRPPLHPDGGVYRLADGERGVRQ